MPIVYYDPRLKRYFAKINRGGATISLGSFKLKRNAQLAIIDYENKLTGAKPDYDLLAHDVYAWNRTAKEIITKLSKDKRAVKLK